MYMMDQIIILIIALSIDLIFADPPNAFHPTAWMGLLINLFIKFTPKNKKPQLQFLYGGLITLFGISLLLGIGIVLTILIKELPLPFNFIITSILLKLTFTLKGLMKVSKKIIIALRANDLSNAKLLISKHLVSRDTSALNESQLSAAAIESVAENSSDSIVAPIFYFLLFGLPGALVYRFVNTADAMLGYRDEKHEWLGKIPARLDDLLNLIPARLTALLFFIGSPFAGCSLKNAVLVWLQDRNKTESPNAGHPMAAAAGSLGIVLNKIGAYSLGETGRLAHADDLKTMVSLMLWAIGIGTVLLIIISLGIKLI